MQQPALDFRQNLIQKIAKWKAGLADLGKRNLSIKFKQDSPRTLEILTDSANILFQNLVFEKKTLNFEMFDSEYQDTSLLKNNKALPGAANPLELITRQTGSEQLKRLEGNFYTSELKFDLPFEEDVYHTLVEQGYTIRTQVGCSGYRIDLAVANKNHPGEFLLGIECDGASYHNHYSYPE